LSNVKPYNKVVESEQNTLRESIASNNFKLQLIDDRISALKQELGVKN